jgi:predicted transcriptional regulator
MTGSELRAARQRMLLTQSHLAAILDVSRPTISYYETGHAKVPQAVALAIEALLHRGPSKGQISVLADLDAAVTV